MNNSSYNTKKYIWLPCVLRSIDIYTYCLIAGNLYALFKKTFTSACYLILPAYVIRWDLFNTNAEVRTQKKITVLFGNFSQMADPPPPPFGNPLFKKKFYRLFCILDP